MPKKKEIKALTIKRTHCRLNTGSAPARNKRSSGEESDQQRRRRKNGEGDDGAESNINEPEENGDGDDAADDELSRGYDGKERAFVHVTSGFAANASEAKNHLPPSAYRAVLLNSKFTLCPSGHNPESYRLFEVRCCCVTTSEG